ncbi:restriction endonuclease subunit S [Streptococcus macacae]|uniref:Type I restriction modification DNA specificity domain protein n=1 Tax=Streptococcus macacae NCTC 11558 TaxID=764298 RepID=G5JYY7_9STRE|nr:restriction endonuclease subunit S [Streptococcus macacae]EHJ52636.1 type I restriction modification DNA specificity domain protein [Streptococcus macacae NCTC 11558]SUN78243.1 type I restriction-modification system S protein [Streptococcus macacae NCTC 11558]
MLYNWETVYLGDVCKIKYGKDHKKLLEGNIPVYGTGGIMRYVDTPLYKNKSVLIPRKGSLGNLYFVDEPFWTVDTLFYTEIDETKILPEFLFYKLKTYDLASMNVGSAVPSLTTSVLNAINIQLPPLSVQEEIVKVLGIIDSKIQNNKKINHHLEEMAQAIFKSWFVDFEPFGGMTPRTWKEKIFFDVAKVNYGKNLPTKNLLSKGYRVFGGNGQIGYYTKFLHQKERILISCRGAASGTVQLSRPFSFITNNSLIINETKDVYFAYLKQWCLNRQFFDVVTGSAQSQVTVDSLKNITIILPDSTTLKEFSNIMLPLYSQIEKNLEENEKLINLRDNLLPKLMSGEILINQAAK